MKLVIISYIPSLVRQPRSCAIYYFKLLVITVQRTSSKFHCRKSPALDGKVERTKEGKEVRYPVILSSKEKLIARKVCLAFKQSICGFDLLRTYCHSYVCDVNGFSFVKSSEKYYDDCAKVKGAAVD